MLYLLGGPPKCGKTTLSKKLSTSLLTPWISADTLQNIIYAYTPAETHASLFPHSYLRGDTNDEFYGAHSSQEIVRNYIAQGATTYDAISMIVETYLADGDDFIVEGYQVTPELVDRLIKKFGSEHIRAVFLGKVDEQKFVEDIHKSTTPNDWIIRKTKDPATYPLIAAMIAEYSRWFEKEAGNYGFQCFLMDNDFEKQLNTIETTITKNL